VHAVSGSTSGSGVLGLFGAALAVVLIARRRNA
jgi:MYXO-CTERM domain-containing protein